MNYLKPFNSIISIAWSTMALMFVVCSEVLPMSEAQTFFEPAVNYSTVNGPLSVAIGDLEEDGAPELAAAIVWIQNYGGAHLVWTQNFGGPSYEEARLVIETADGSLIVAGWSNTADNKEDVYVVKTDGNGGLIWENRYGTEIHERSYSIRETADGFVIAGRATSLEIPPKEHVLLLKVGKNGGLIWKKLFENDQASGARDVQVTSDGGYALVGYVGK